jgi:hypothetical protein
MRDILYRVRAVNHMPEEIRESLLEFRVDGKALGKVRPAVAEMLCCCRGGGNKGLAAFAVHGEGYLTLAGSAGSTYESRTAAVAGVMERLRDAGVIPGWRDELYPVGTGFYREPVFAMERAAVPWLGAIEYGVHINGLVQNEEDGETSMWMARRAADKSKYPGMMDHMAAGGQPVGLGLMENVIKECYEEAGVPEDLCRRGIRPAGAVSYETFNPSRDIVVRELGQITGVQVYL